MPLEVRFNKRDSFKDVKVVEVPKPTIKNDDEVIVRFVLNPINPSDVLSIAGVYDGFRPESYPAVPGFEGVGVIDAVGKAVDTVEVGQRVIIAEKNRYTTGTWRDYAVYKQNDVIPVPDNISDETAAQAIVNPLTAYTMLDEVNVPKGEYLLQTAGGSVIGRLIIQFAKIRGVKTISLVRRKEQIQELKELGADEVLCTEDGTSIYREIKRITNGKLAYGAFDSIGGDMGVKISQCVRNDGHVFLYGALSGSLTVTVSTQALLFRNVHYNGFWLSKFFKESNREKVLNTFMNVFELMSNGITPLAGKKFPLEKISEALEYSEKVARGGKVLLTHNTKPSKL